MQDKHKVTLYLPPELHRQLKIRSAVELEPMSAIAERAIVFYLTHSDVVDEVEMSYGQTHRMYNCPECSSSLVLKQGEMVSVREESGILIEEGSPVSVSGNHSGSDQRDEGELVPC
ncbi:MAG: hypothetical protein HC769_08165 [Cyanobacteria bacterium CRU_2_1]|nr:hypothetical protein [Cyanobacteria bacterium RU_5_0]NJR58824.1 hypothetical protein [Cyanobacteria bacterium CRU_2_1]